MSQQPPWGNQPGNNQPYGQPGYGQPPQPYDQSQPTTQQPRGPQTFGLPNAGPLHAPNFDRQQYGVPGEFGNSQAAIKAAYEASIEAPIPRQKKTSWLAPVLWITFGVVALLVVFVVIFGGDSISDDDKDAQATAVDTFIKAAAVQDTAGMYSLLTAEARTAIGDQSKLLTFSSLPFIAGYQKLDGDKFGSTTISGKTTFQVGGKATYNGTEKRFIANLQQVNGVWLLNAIDLNVDNT